MSDLCKCGCGKIVKPGNRFLVGHHRRGVSASYDTRRRMSESAKHKKTYSKIPVLCKCGCGKNAIRGKEYAAYHSPHIRKGRSDIIKAKWADAEFRNRTLETMRSDRCRELHREISKRQFQNPTQRKMASDRLRNNWIDPEVRKKIVQRIRKSNAKAAVRKRKSKAAKKRWSDADFRKRAIAIIRNFTQRPEYKEKISKHFKKMWQDPKHRKRIQERQKELWSCEEYKINTLQAMFASFAKTPNKPERRLRKLLKKLFPGEYKYVGNGKVWIAGRNPDFINVNGQKKIIEMFGDYWHGRKVTGKRRNVHRKERQLHFKKYGYRTLVIWEHQLKDTDKVTQRLVKFHNK